MASEQPVSRTYEAIGMFVFDNIASRFGQMEVFRTNLFWSVEDEKDPTKFIAKVNFGKCGGTWIDCYVKPINRKIHASRVNFKWLDVDFEVVAQRAFEDQVLGTDLDRGCTKLLEWSDGWPKDTLYFQCRISFRRLPDTESSGFPINFRDPSLHEDFHQLFEHLENTDVKIVVGDKTFRAHKLILAARSEYFRALFRSGMTETVNNEVKIHDVDPPVFNELLKFLYCGLPPSSRIVNAKTLLPLADRFGVLGLKDLCVSAIGNVLHVGNVLDTLQLAHRFNCPSLMEICVPLIKTHQQTLKTTEEWERLIGDNELAAVVFGSL